ncbi:MAG: hypothetical protein CMF59_19485 [Leptospiraceae bacterium]|nr:hypothetical protein [Leptospiraceae bacterium]
MNQTVHFILKGTLDRPMVESIVDEISGRPHIRYRADGSALYSVDFASACLLKDRVEKSGSQLAILDLNSDCRVALQYCGWSLHDGVALCSSTSQPDDREEQTGPAAHCPSCARKLQIQGSGLYSCPACGTHFRVDQNGRTTPYESLGIAK